MLNLIDKIEENEGFSSKPYIDILVENSPQDYGIPDDEFEIIQKHFDKLKITFGYGSTYITKKGARAVVEDVIGDKISDILRAKPIIHRLPLEKQEVIFEMVYQLGVSGVLRFRNMWGALEVFNYEEAAVQMLDSLWATQTKSRAEKLAKIMGGLS